MKTLSIVVGVLALVADFSVLAKDLRESLEPHQEELMETMKKYQKDPPPLKGKTIPNTVLDSYNSNAAAKKKILKSCANAHIVPNAKTFDVGSDGKAAGMSYIHFLAIPIKPVANIWSVEHEQTVKDLRDCWQQFIKDGGSKQLMKVEKDKAKHGHKNKAARQHNPDMKNEAGGDLKVSDYVDFFHIPPSINYLHMHVVSNKAELRQHSNDGPDDRSLLADNAIKVLETSKPTKKEDKKEDKKEGGGKHESKHEEKKEDKKAPEKEGGASKAKEAGHK